MTDGAVRWAALRELSLARLRLFWREPGTLFWTFVFPILMSVVLGAAFRSRPPQPAEVVVAEGPGAPALVEALRASSEVRPRLLPAPEAERALFSGRVSVMVTASHDDGSAAHLRYDPSRPESRLGRALVVDALERARGRRDLVATTEERVTEAGARYIDFLIPGLIGMGLMSSGLWGIGFSLAEMRSKKLLKRLVATPMRRSDFLASFLVVRAALVAVELPPLLLFASFVWGVPVRGSLALVALVALTGALTFAMLGLLVASRAENPQVVSGLINVISFPMLLCSGVFFSSENFPSWSQPIIGALPLTALIDALRGVMLDGRGITWLAKPMGVVGLWGLSAFVLALRLFRWR
ncbi:MAG: ABC transporter permease [Myxococcales bacterium]|nr:ABC transporter permease [Myxococcales bacterium]